MYGAGIFGVKKTTTRKPSFSVIIFCAVLATQALGAETVYRDSAHQFRITFPDGWESKAGSAISTVIKAVDADENNINISLSPPFPSQVFPGDLSESMSVELFLGIQEKLSNATLHKSKMTYLDNRKAIYMLFSGTRRVLDEKTRIKMMMVSTIHNNRVFTVSCGGGIDAFPAIEDICEKSISTLVFEDYWYP